MLTQALVAGGLVMATVAIHAVECHIHILTLAHPIQDVFLSVTGLVIALTCWLILIHLAEIAVWALNFYWQSSRGVVDSVNRPNIQGGGLTQPSS